MACISELGFDEAVKQPDIKAVVELVLAEAFPDDTTRLEHFRRGLEAPNMAQAYAWQATEGFSVKDELDAIACPVLVLHGTADPLIPFRLGKWIGDTIGHARFVGLQGAGHSVQVERAAEFNEALLEFLSCA
jgi:pimeloyl-ACP methyl ester carboxylesterase